MDPLAIFVLAFVLVIVSLALLSARSSAHRPLSGSGARRRTVSAARQLSDTELEDQDLTEMLAATNARRLARGLKERSRAEALQEFGAE